MLAVLAAALSVGVLTDTARTAASGPVLVVATHPDDESLAFAGAIETAIAAGRDVVVAVVSNGANTFDANTDAICGATAGQPAGYVRFALARDRESIDALQVLDTQLDWSASLSSKVLFLGYPDSTLATLGSSTDPTGLNTTFALDEGGTCNGDYHYLRTTPHAHAPLTAASLAGDIAALIAQVQPVDIYTHAISDGHSDHAVVARTVLEAVRAQARAIAVHTSLVHPTGDFACMADSAHWWPGPEEVAASERSTPDEPFGPPPVFPGGTDTGYAPCPDGKPVAHDWGPLGAPTERIPVPGGLDKWHVIEQYASQLGCPDGASCGYMHAFVKQDEIAWTQTISSTSEPVPVDWPRLTSDGGVAVGAKLSVVPGRTFFLGATSTTYQWLRCDAEQPWGSRCAPITDATESSYTITADDLGFALRVAVVGHDTAGASPPAYSGTTSPIPVKPANTDPPTATGNPFVGSTLTATTGTWTGTPAPSFTYAWQSSSTATGPWTDIGDGKSTYAIASGDLGKYLRVEVTAKNGGGSDSAVSAVAAAKPSVQSPPTVTGTAAVGSTLTASPGAWTAAPVPSLAYAWQSSASPTGGWTAIAGATSAAYVVKAGDAGRYLRVEVTVTNTVGATTADSAVVQAPPVSQSPPALSGSAVVGSTLTASPGTWSGWPAPTFAYVWQSSASGTGDWTNVAGATSSTYTVRSDDAGRYLRVSVTATNTAGTATAVSPATAKVSASSGGGGGGGGGGGSSSSGGGSSNSGGGGGGGGGYAADLALTGAVVPTTAASGQSLVWTVTVTNANLGPAVDAYVDLQLSANLTIAGTIATRGPGCVVLAGNKLHCFLDWMSGDAPVATVTVATIVAQAGDYTLDAKVGQLIPDQKPENDTLRLTAAAPAPPPPPPPAVVAPTISIVKTTLAPSGTAKVVVRIAGWAVNAKSVKNADATAAAGYWVISVDGKRNAISRSATSGTTKPLAPGRHTIRVELVHENGKVASPRVLSKPVVVTVKKRAHR
jgi:LmbE family N-acetylglucosaminyl deacetylase